LRGIIPTAKKLDTVVAAMLRTGSA